MRRYVARPDPRMFTHSQSKRHKRYQQALSRESCPVPYDKSERRIVSSPCFRLVLLEQADSLRQVRGLFLHARTSTFNTLFLIFTPGRTNHALFPKLLVPGLRYDYHGITGRCFALNNSVGRRTVAHVPGPNLKNVEAVITKRADGVTKVFR